MLSAYLRTNALSHLREEIAYQLNMPRAVKAAQSHTAVPHLRPHLSSPCIQMSLSDVVSILGAVAQHCDNVKK